MDPNATPPSGFTVEIPGYTIISELGKGGMATVYLAIQQNFGRKVALKIMSPALNTDPSFSERFLREARIVAGLSHPNIVQVYDVGEHEGYNYIAMEYHPGGDLQERIAKGLTIEEAVHVIQQIALALDYAHSKGYIHRDVKPDNVLFREDNSAVLTDFGIAKPTATQTRQMTQVGKVIGTPKYMSPEQARGQELDSRADLYALGIMFYEALTGHVPFDGEDAIAIGIKHIKEPIPPLEGDLACFQDILEQFLAKEVDDRFQYGRDVVDALDEVPFPHTDGSVRTSGGRLAHSPSGRARRIRTPSGTRDSRIVESRDRSGLGWLYAILGIVAIAGVAFAITPLLLPDNPAVRDFYARLGVKPETTAAEPEEPVEPASPAINDTTAQAAPPVPETPVSTAGNNGKTGTEAPPTVTAAAGEATPSDNDGAPPTEPVTSQAAATAAAPDTDTSETVSSTGDAPESTRIVTDTTTPSTTTKPSSDTDTADAAPPTDTPEPDRTVAETTTSSSETERPEDTTGKAPSPDDTTPPAADSEATASITPAPTSEQAAITEPAPAETGSPTPDTTAPVETSTESSPASAADNTASLAGAPTADGTDTQTGPDAAPPQPEGPDATTRALIDRLLAEADTDIEQQRLSRPEGESALDKYNEILSLDPDNTAAQEGIRKLATTYVAMAREAIDKRALDRARTYLRRARDLGPEVPGIDTASTNLARAEEQARAERLAVQKTAEQEAAEDQTERMVERFRITGLLKSAEYQLAQNHLTEPPGENALEKYREVLAIDSDNAEARAGVQKVTERLVQLASQALERGDTESARDWTLQAIKANPDHPRVQTLREKISRLEKAAPPPPSP